MPSIMAAMASSGDTFEALPPYQCSVPVSAQAYKGSVTSAFSLQEFIAIHPTQLTRYGNLR